MHEGGEQYSHSAMHKSIKRKPSNLLIQVNFVYKQKPFLDIRC
jgi:hypothetical protein